MLKKFPLHSDKWKHLLYCMRNLRGPDSTALECLFEIDEEHARTDNTAIFRGWLVLKKDKAVTNVCVEIIDSENSRSHPAEIQIRPEVALRFPDYGNAERSGFLIKAPMHARWNLAVLKYFHDGEWQPFARRVVITQRVDRKAKHEDVAQQPWPALQPLVSVIIPCHNYGKYLAEAVDSVLSQTWRDLEVIVVDDGSDDPATIRILDSLDQTRTRVIRQKNLKLPAARNTGVKAAKGKYICCLDADDMLAPTYIEKCVSRLEVEGFDICGSWQRNFGEEDAIHKPGEFTLKNLFHSNQMINCAVFRRQLWEEAEGFDETMVDGYEDWEFWIRLAAREAKAAVIPLPLFLYRKHGRSMIDSTLEKHEDVVHRIHEKHASLTWTDTRTTPSTPGAEAGRKKWANLLAHGTNNHEGKPCILLCLPFLTLGGAEKILSQLCARLTDRGFRFVVITTELAPDSLGDSTAWFEACTAEIHQLPTFLEVANWDGYIAYLIRTRNVRVLLQVGSSFVYNLLPDLKTLFPYLKAVDFLFNEVGHTANNRKYDYLIDQIVTETEHTKSWLVAHGESEGRIRVIPNGIDLSHLRSHEEPATPFDTRGRKFVVAFFGRLMEEKGPDIFVRIAGRLKKETDIHFVIAGSGPMEPLIRRQIAEEKLEDSVQLLGYQSAKTHLPFCDVLVAPSRQDGRPNVVMEGMAMGIPVVAARVGGIPELVHDGHDGFLCTAADIEEFAAKILALLRDREMHARCKANAQAHAAQSFDIDRTVQAFNDTFHEIIGPAARL